MSCETSALWFSNYANLATKALRPKLSASFAALSSFYSQQALKKRGNKVTDNKTLLEPLENLIKDCTGTLYPTLQKSAADNRGALRAFTWGNKVATILKSIIGRVATKGDNLLTEGQAFYVCDACGFMYVGEKAPEICPICKAPESRFVRY